MPVWYLVDTETRLELPHAIGRVYPPVETDRDDAESVLAKGFLRNFNLVAKIAGDRWADMVATRIDHADDKRFATQL